MRSIHCFGLCCLVVFATAVVDPICRAAPRTWVGGNNNWDSTTANWSPADEPDSNDDAVFNTPNFVTMTINQTLEGLSLSNGASVSTSTQSLNVNGTIDLDDPNTSLTIFTNAFIIGTPPVVSVNADDVIVTGGAEFFMANDVTIHDTSTSGGSDSDTIGVVTIGSGSTFNGNGRLLLNNSISSSVVLFQNNGTINALSYGNPNFVTAGTLTLDAPDPDSRIDLDGTSGTGAVNVFRSQTLDMNIRQNDDFDGTINIFATSTLDFQHAWELNGTLDVNSGFIAGIPPFGIDQPAGIAVVDGGTVTMSESDSRINVVHNDGTLQLNAPLVANNGVIDNNGHLIFNADATIGSGVDFFMEFDADLTVNANVTVNDADWNWDDNGGSNNDIVINDNGTLNANITASGASVWNGDMHINGGTLNVQGDNDNWEQVGRNVLFEGTSLGVIGGDQFILTNGTVRVEPGANGDISASTRWDGGTLDVDGELELIGAVEWAGTTVTGDGVLEQEGNATVTSSTTIAVDTYDWDQSSTTVNPGVTFTVDVDRIDRSDDTFNSNAVTINGGELLVTVADGSWTLGNGGVLNLSSPGTQVALLNGFGSDMVVASGGVINASAADARIAVPLTLQEGSEVRLTGTNPKFRGVGMVFDGGDVVDPSGNGTFDPIGMTVTGESSITASRFIWDVAATSIEPTGTLNIDVDDFGADNSVDGVSITMNSGDINLSVSTSLQMNGDFRMNNTAGDPPVLSGGSVIFGSDINVGGTGDSEIASPVSFVGTPTVDVDADARLIFTGNVVLLGGVAFTGDGTVAFDSETTTVTNAMTVNMPNGVFDLDGDTVISDTFIIRQPLTLNVGGLEAGNDQFDGDTLFIDPNGSLTIDLPGSSGWVMNGTLELNGNDDGTFALQLAGDDVELRGIVDVTDRSLIEVNTEITGTINLTTADSNLRINGRPTGNQFLTPIRIRGGAIDGPGVVSMNNSRSLIGFGTISADIDFDGPNAELLADDGELIVSGTILDAGAVGTNDADGILNVTNSWDTDSAGGVELNGGELRGAKVTVNGFSSFDGITGHGLITSQVVNEGTIRSSGGTLTIRHRTNNDYGGVSNSGTLTAGAGDLVIENDPLVANVYFFEGNLSAFNGNALVLEELSSRMAPESSLTLASGTLRSTRSILFQGEINVSGVSTLERNGTLSTPSQFEAGSTTNIDGELQLKFIHRIHAGAEFTGVGKLTNMSTLDFYDGADLGVHVENQSALRLLDFTNFSSGPSLASVASLEQLSSGRLFFDITGTDFEDYSRLQVGGTATLDGGISLFLDDAFEPALGDTFTVLTAGQIVGTFSFLQDTLAELGPGLAWDLIYNPTGVQLTVIANLTADADLDGDVDGADFLLLQRTNPTLIPDWRLQYGTESAAEFSSNSAVPEPSTVLLLMLGVSAACWLRLGSRFAEVGDVPGSRS